ncbi:hypothetical protein ACFSYH_11050 [Populibacterium corticicola]|uniref:Yip1 domain-containing protein n=1 Tax=Populibacterium corticicola TaxID=1812826 RepID=A0ABW5XGX1_9MICO
MSFQSFAPLPHELPAPPPHPPQQPHAQQPKPFRVLLAATGAILAFNPSRSIKLLKWHSKPQHNALTQIALLQCVLVLVLSFNFPMTDDPYRSAEAAGTQLFGMLAAQIVVVLVWPILALLGMVTGFVTRQRISFIDALSAAVAQTYLTTLWSVPLLILTISSNLVTPLTFGLFLVLSACGLVLPPVFGGLMLGASSSGRRTNMMLYVTLQLAVWVFPAAFYVFDVSGYYF